MKSRISILLVEPENPDNIGAAARAMKNMTLADLRLVKPPVRWKSRARKMAVSAYGVVEAASVFTSVEEAVQDAHGVVGLTRRIRRFDANRIAFDEGIRKILGSDPLGSDPRKVILMFGKESKGLSNEDLEHCDWILTIPANPVFSSINLAQAVMIVGFTLFQKRRSSPNVFVGDPKDGFPLKARGNDIVSERQAGQGGRLVTKKETYEVLEVFESALRALRYAEEGELVIGRIRRTFHGLLKRSGLLEREAQMFKGLTRRIQTSIVQRAERKASPHPCPLP